MATVKFVGDTTFQLCGPGQWGRETLGINKLTERWQGAVNKLDDFQAKNADSKTHATYSAMWLSAYDSDDDPVMPTVTLQYLGFRSGKPRDPIYRASYSLQTIQTTATLPNAGKSSIDVQFYAPTGEWDWYEIGTGGEAPEAPAHNTVKSTVSPLDRIVRWSVKAESGQTQTVSLADLTAAINALQTVQFVQDYSPDPIIPGYLWHCKSTVIRTLQPS